MDSDSDDELLVGSGLTRRQEKAESRSREKQHSILHDALTDSKRLCTSAFRVSALKKGSMKRDDEALRCRVQDLTKKFNKDKAADQTCLDDIEGLDLSKQDQILDREHRLKLVQATDTDQSTGWGQRSIVSFCPTRCTDLHFYSSQKEVIDALRMILTTCDKENQCTALNSILTVCLDKSLLEAFLQDKTAIARILLQNNVAALDDDIFLWLKNTCQSAGLLRSQGFLIGAQGNLETLIRDGFCPPHVRASPLTQFASELDVWIDTRSISNSSMQIDEATTSTNNLPGLILVLRYWNALLSSPWEPPSFDAEVASDCLVKCCMLGLDSATSSSQTTRGIRSLLHNVIPLFLDFVATKMKEKTECWMDQVAEVVVDRISILGPGKEGSDDERDTHAWMCHSVVLQTIPLYLDKEENGFQKHRLSNLFRAKLAIRALHVLSKAKPTTIPDWRLDNEGLSTVCKEAFHAAVGGLIHLNALGEDILEVAPLCPACVECSTAAFESGRILSYLETNSRADDAVNRAKSVARVLDHLDGQSFQLKKLMSGMVTTNPHIRRAHNHLNICSQYYRVYLPRALSSAGEGETTEHQTTLDFFKMKS